MVVVFIILSISSGDVMNTWTKQKGYPILKVTMEQDGDTRIIILKQEKFTANGTEDPDKPQWLIPIRIISENYRSQVKNYNKNKNYENVS